jgi:ABC-type sugar transport system ATPase subunit
VAEYLEFKNITKTYPGVKALADVSFRAEGGRVTALLGENGAGKSTLLKILSGDLNADTGEMLMDGEVLNFRSPYDAIQSSISVIYQERQMVDSMSVMENIFAGELPKNKFGFIDHAKLKQDAQEIIDAFGLPLDPKEPVARLSVARQQMVEIMRAYHRNSDVIAFDEPTASLSDTEIDVLFRLIEKLKNEGKIVIYVSHRMAEIFKVTDDIIVLKDGKLVKELRTVETDEAELIKAMVGRDIGDTYAKLTRNENQGDVILEVKNLTTTKISNVSFTLHRGEVIGFAGLVGAGRTELARAIFGVDPILSGEIILDGKPVRFKSPTDAIAAGIALCPEDRKEQGLVLIRSIKDNVTIPVLSRVRKFIFLDNKQESELTDSAVAKYSIKTPTIEKITSELSGGNQQKVILGRWTSEKMTTKILILDEPTKGIDVGTKAEIYQMILDFAKSGIGVIFISSELTEVLNISDSIYVMRGGGITGQVNRAEATEESVLRLAMLG